MNNLITIQSKIYSGKTLNIVFIPDNQHIKIDLGNHVIPYNFNSALLSPPREVYGQYIINSLSGDCLFNLFVVRPTPTNTPSPTKTPTNTQTPSVTSTNTLTPTPTPTNTECFFPTYTPTSTPTSTNTPTPTNTPTNTECFFPTLPNVTPTNTPSNSSTPSNTPTNTGTPTQTSTPTITPTPTNLPIQTPSVTSTNTQTPTNTSTPTNTNTQTSTQTSTPTSTNTQTPTNTSTPTNTNTQTPTTTNTQTPTNTPTPSVTTGLTPTATETPTQTPTNTSTNTPTNTETPTNTPTETPTTTPTQTPTNTKTPTNTPTPSVTIGLTPTATETTTPTPTNTPTNTRTPTQTTTQTPTQTTPLSCDFTYTLVENCDAEYQFLGVPPSLFVWEYLNPGDYIDGSLQTIRGTSSVRMTTSGGSLVPDCVTSGITFAGLGTEVPQFQNYLVCGIPNTLTTDAYRVISPIEMTFTFTPAVTNPLLAFWSLGQSGICQTFSADTNFQNFPYCYNTAEQPLTLDLVNRTITACEGFGVLEFQGTFSQIKLSVLSTECRTNFLWANIIWGFEE
jgi:hypothetical protein